MTKLYVLPDKDDPLESDDGFVQTGPETIDMVVEAIRLGQSVILSGPRGCGKSHCIREAIKAAAKRGITTPGADVFLQGNRELPRDYLVEDDITLRYESASKTVIPELKEAPLFRFAKRDLETGSLFSDTTDEAITKNTLKDDRVVRCEINGERIDRFVLFLDEINRFSDGVLDSLLTVLEERTTVLAGSEYKLPVTVCMTMNPPGYDGTARRLSPPLQARIGRSWRLYSPDLETQTSIIIANRLKEIQKEIQAKSDLEFEIHPILRRKVALVTLCLWGVPSRSDVAYSYLTPPTRKILKTLAENDSRLEAAMRKVQELCHFGPDGRAAPDWIHSASALAVRDAQMFNRSRAEITERELKETAIDTLSHKLCDGFSAASEPEKESQKHEAILTIVKQILDGQGGVRVVVERGIDKPEEISKLFREVVKRRVKWEDIRDAFSGAFVTHKEDVDLWFAAVEEFGSLDAENREQSQLKTIFYKHKIMCTKDNLFSAVGDDALTNAAFTTDEFHSLAENLAKLAGTREGKTLPACLSEILEHAGRPRPTVEQELWAKYRFIRTLGVRDQYAKFVEVYSASDASNEFSEENKRYQENLLAGLMDSVWSAARLQPDSEDWPKRVIGQFEEVSAEMWDGGVRVAFKNLLDWQLGLADKVDVLSWLRGIPGAQIVLNIGPQSFRWFPGIKQVRAWLGKLRPVKKRVPHRQYLPDGVNPKVYYEGIGLLISSLPKAPSPRGDTRVVADDQGGDTGDTDPS